MNQDDAEFGRAIDSIVNERAAGDDAEYYRLWRRLYHMGLKKTRPNKTYLKTLKKRLYASSGGTCAECRAESEMQSLEMDRLSTEYHWSKTNHFGYFEENVELVCTQCHDTRELNRQSKGQAVSPKD